MANKRLSLSKEGKDLLEESIASLSLERVLVLKISLAKGIATDEEISMDTTSKPVWTIPDSIIKENEYLMFKHLIISKFGSQMNEQEVQDHILFYIEKGIRVIHKEIQNKNSLEDSRFVIL